MDKRPFFKNFGGILTYAFFGTFISALFIGGPLYALGSAGGLTVLYLSPLPL